VKPNCCSGKMGSGLIKLGFHYVLRSISSIIAYNS